MAPSGPTRTGRFDTPRGIGPRTQTYGIDMLGFNLFGKKQDSSAEGSGVLGELEVLRYIGYRGEFIFKHRAMLTLPSASLWASSSSMS